MTIKGGQVKFYWKKGGGICFSNAEEEVGTQNIVSYF